MQKIIFVDAHGWVALKHKGDSFFSEAQKLNKTLLLERTAFITTNFVLDEAYTVLRARAGHHVAVEFGEEIRVSKLTSVIHISPEIEAEAWAMFKRKAIFRGESGCRKPRQGRDVSELTTAFRRRLVT